MGVIDWPVLPARRPDPQADLIERARAACAALLFEWGCDTAEIARILCVGEPRAARLLERGRNDGEMREAIAARAAEAIGEGR